MQSILDGVTLIATHRAESCGPAVVEGDHNVEKEVHCPRVGISGDACDQLGQGSERKPSAKCCVELAGGPQED